jgi:hypothetical protein
MMAEWRVGLSPGGHVRSAGMGTRAVIVGIFEAGCVARAALGVLHGKGYAAPRVGFAVRHGELTQASGALEAIDVPEHDLLGGLVAMGVPLAGARMCATEFERGRAIVAVQAHDRLPEAAGLLRKTGAVLVLAPAA